MLVKEGSIRPKIWIAFIAVWLVSTGHAQQANGISKPVYTKAGSWRLDQIQRWEKRQTDPRLKLPLAQAGLDFYKLRYSSTDLKGEPETLSGLVILPENHQLKGLILYYHGTTADVNLSPSRFPAHGNSEAEYVALMFATGGYAVILPDYIGLGDDSAHVHPYPLADINSKSGIDMFQPALTMAADLGFNVGADFFVTGYSEGGAAAMWAMRHLEEQPLTANVITAAAPMSGPYDLSGVEAKSLLNINKDIEGTAIKLYLIGFAAYAAQVDENANLRQYFVPSMASYIPFVFSKRPDDQTIAKKLTFKSIELGGIDSIRRDLTWRFRQALIHSDYDDPLLAELKQNDCYDWAPHTPMLLPYLTTDEIVVPENTQEAIMAMRQRCVFSYLVRDYPIKDPTLNHITAAPIAMAAARRFFDSFTK